mmetsp:Transcript_10373/g.31904  ORF Transcript_10373/g.31904 Transcript_10373/m.31904 type:complete len:234 (-) Transcript_10373:1196-1897(-)
MRRGTNDWTNLSQKNLTYNGSSDSPSCGMISLAFVAISAMNGDVSSLISSMTSHLILVIAVSAGTRRDSSAATSSLMPLVTTVWNSSCTTDMSTFPEPSETKTLLMDSSSCPVVSWQYLHVLMAVHTICCCARSRLQLGAIDTSDGWPTAFSCSCTFLAYARRCFAHTRCKSRSTTSICSAVPRLNDRLRLRKSSLEELKTRESGRPLVGASHRSSPSSCPNASPMFLSSSET